MSLAVGSSLPAFDDTMTWLNTENENNSPTLVATRPILVHFWALSCPACKINMPALQELRDKYAPLGLQTIAVHSPRGYFDVDPEAVKKMAGELGMTEPCAIDDESKIVEAFQTGDKWPTYFVFGPNHKLKVRAAGGFGVKMCASALRNVFGESQT